MNPHFDDETGLRIRARNGSSPSISKRRLYADALRRFPRARDKATASWVAEHPANQDFLHAMARVHGLSPTQWLAPREVVVNTPDGRLTAFIERDPLHALHMGNYFDCAEAYDWWVLYLAERPEAGRARGGDASRRVDSILDSRASFGRGACV